MAAVPILPTDPQVRKKWNLKVASDSIREQYFARHIGDEGSDALIVRKTELEKGAGDEVVSTLTAKVKGRPVVEGEKLAGRELSLNFATHKMRINIIRQGINVGSVMDQKRVDIKLGATAREKLRGYISELYEETIVCALSGARGVGDEIQHWEVGYTGYPNALVAPDAGHLFTGPLNTRTGGPGGTLVAGDVADLKMINLLQLKAKKFGGGVADGKSVKMKKVVREGKKFWVFAAMPEVIQDIRNDVSTAGWFEAQRMLTQNIGKQSELFQGGAGWFNGVIIDEIEVGVKFNNYGAGSNVNAARSLFMGANAGVIANGMSGMETAVELEEETDDRGNEKIVHFKMIFGADKTRYTPSNGATATDYAVITVDTSFTAAV